MWPYPPQPETTKPPAHRKTTMTRMSSLFVASTLAILPISAFAQPTAAPAKTTEPATMTTTTPPSPAEPALR